MKKEQVQKDLVQKGPGVEVPDPQRPGSEDEIQRTRFRRTRFRRNRSRRTRLRRTRFRKITCRMTRCRITSCGSLTISIHYQYLCPQNLYVRRGREKCGSLCIIIMCHCNYSIPKGLLLFLCHRTLNYLVSMSCPHALETRSVAIYFECDLLLKSLVIQFLALVCFLILTKSISLKIPHSLVLDSGTATLAIV